MKSEKLLSFEEALKIDKYSLDNEWLKLPMLYYEWSTIYSQAVLERDKEKQRLELVKTEIESRIRKEPSRYGIKKGTEGEINSCVISSEEYQKALERYQNSVYNLNIISGALEALGAKKSALENVTKLFLSGYYIKNVVPNEGRQIIEKQARVFQEEELNKSLTKKLNRKGGNNG